MHSHRVVVGICALLMAVGSIAGYSSAANGSPSPSDQARTSVAKPATPHWGVVPSVNAQPSYFGDAVSCPTATFCMLVGTTTGSPTAHTDPQGIAEIWNGHSWTIVTPPSVPAEDIFLNAVSCASASFCVAVGNNSPTSGPELAVIDQWNGHSWTSEPSTSFPGGVFLTGVSCTSKTFCMTVGESGDNAQCLDGGHADPGDDALAEEWNGTSWLVDETPSFGTCGTANTGHNGYEDAFNAVSCVSGTSCLAVGTFFNSAGVAPIGAQTAGATWNGTTWTAQPGLNPNSSDGFDGVSCTSADACLAVGTTAGDVPPLMALAEEWNGNGWTDVSPTTLGASGSFAAVSCTKPSRCVVVGAGTGNGTLVATWTGATNWSRQHAPQVTRVSGVSCASSTSCMAAGFAEFPFNGNTTTSHAVALVGPGSAYRLVIPTDPFIEPSQLASASCVGKTCVAVGSFTVFGTDTWPLIEIGHGRTWRNSPAANEGSAVAELTGVSCISATSCVAVGSEDLSGVESAFSQKWDGKVWSHVATASTTTTPTVLNAVSCTGPHFCMAVGQESRATPGKASARTEIWDGMAWRSIPAASPGTASNDLDAVSCTASTRCVAVGQQVGTSGHPLVLTERWNGDVWAVIHGRNPGQATNALLGVSCPSRRGCIAVGYQSSGSRRLTLVEALLNGRWIVRKSPNAPHASSAFATVSCRSLTSCEAVGHEGTSVTRTLAATLAGTKWAITKSANHGSKSNSLSGVSCSAAQCEAVGVRTARVAQTLIELLVG